MKGKRTLRKIRFNQQGVFQRPRIVELLIIGVGLMVLSSCATVPRVPDPGMVHPVPAQIIRQDIAHVVAPGETLWRISKVYDVGIRDIMRKNDLSDDNKLTMGQTLVIPHAMPARAVIPLYSSNKWKYIIIHHSASDEGNALLFHRSHMNYRGFSRGLGYHFVIDNGTYGKPKGYIEVSPRWIKQQDGAHCKASGMNRKSIGVCLVGNFSKRNLSDKQLSALVYLVNILRRRYNVPLKNIMGHGQVPNAATECPGTMFPWNRFFALLRNAGD